MDDDEKPYKSAPAGEDNYLYEGYSSAMLSICTTTHPASVDVTSLWEQAVIIFDDETDSSVWSPSNQIPCNQRIGTEAE